MSAASSGEPAEGADIELPYFVARPGGPGPFAGVVVIHEANGITSQLLRICERLCRSGFVALAPDLFFRAGGPEASGYAELVASLDPEQVKADLGAAADSLTALGTSKLGVLGFCMGGRLAYRCAVDDRRFSAAVSFYGSGITTIDGEPGCPVQLFFGRQDPWIPAEEIEALAARHEGTIVYPDAGHGFMRDRSEDYAPTAASDAWERSLDFLSANLR